MKINDNGTERDMTEAEQEAHKAWSIIAEARDEAKGKAAADKAKAKAALLDKLKQADNINELLNILINKFDLKNCKPGTITKTLLANNLVSMILPMLNPYEK